MRTPFAPKTNTIVMRLETNEDKEELVVVHLFGFKAVARTPEALWNMARMAAQGLPPAPDTEKYIANGGTVHRIETKVVANATLGISPSRQKQKIDSLKKALAGLSASELAALTGGE